MDAAAIARFHPYTRGDAFTAGAFLGAGVQTYWRPNAPVTPLGIVGAEAGYRWFRVSLELQLTVFSGNVETSVLPGVSIAVPL